MIALRQAGHPLTRLADLRTDPVLRDRVLERVTDPQVVRFFRARMDPWGRDAAVMKESTLNRADLLTLSPLLRYSLGAPDTVLPFRRVLDSGTSVILNLAVPFPGCKAALRVPAHRGWRQRPSHERTCHPRSEDPTF